MRLSWRTVKVSISLPKKILSEVDEIAKAVEISRSEVIADVLDYVVKDEEIISKIYPLEEEDEEEEEKQGGD